MGVVGSGLVKVVLTATDESEQAIRAVNMAASIADKFGSELIIVSALQFDELSSDEIRFAENEFHDQLSDDLRSFDPRTVVPGGISLGQQLTHQAALSRAVHNLLGERRLNNAVARAKSAGAKQISTKLLEGDPATEIVEAATSANADLIVVGRRGRGRTASMLLGSVSARVIELSTGPVMTVP